MKRCSLLCFVIASAIASVALATDRVWYEAHATPVVGNGALINVQGAPGVSTQLLCNSITASFCEWQFSMFFSSDEADLPMIQWATDLSTASPGGTIIPELFAYDDPTPTFDAHWEPFILNPSPGFIIRGSGAADLTMNGIQGGTFQLANFQIKKQIAPESLEYDEIIASVGNGEWAQTDGNYARVAAGSNPQASGEAGTVWGTVITIQNIPEPGAAGAMLIACILLSRQ